MSETLDTRENSGMAILDRVILPEGAPMTPDAARTLLSFKFQESDERRMNRLAAKARKGTLTERDRVEVEQYNLVGHLLALLQAKARKSLKEGSQGSVSA